MKDVGMNSLSNMSKGTYNRDNCRYSVKFYFVEFGDFSVLDYGKMGVGLYLLKQYYKLS